MSSKGLRIVGWTVVVFAALLGTWCAVALFLFDELWARILYGALVLVNAWTVRAMVRDLREHKRLNNELDAELDAVQELLALLESKPPRYV